MRKLSDMLRNGNQNKVTIKTKKKYRIIYTGNYFRDKYGVTEPLIYIEGIDHDVFGTNWESLVNTNMACRVFDRRISDSTYTYKHDLSSPVYYGKIERTDDVGTFGECVFLHELEEIK